MTSRRNRVYLTLAQKYQVILLMERGESRKKIMQKFNISVTTLYRIYAQREKIQNEFKIGTLAFSHSMSRIAWQRLVDVDRVVFNWYFRCKERNVKVCGADIQRKAIEINEKLNGFPSFRASPSWLRSFKQRYHITIPDYREGLRLTITFTELEAFTVNFNELLQKDGFKLKNVYNAVYTEMIWKSGPEGTPISNSTKLTESIKTPGDYVTALLCTNATGCHKLPALIIGNVPESECLCNLDPDISTIYKYKNYPSMDNTIFTNWFTESFIYSVTSKHEWGSMCREKSLLLLHNRTSLHDLTALNNIHPFVTVMSSPLSIATFVQPMNCGVISCFKRKYRIEFLKRITLLPMYDVENEMINRYKALSMWDCCRIVHTAWSNVDHAVLIYLWDTLLKPRIMWSAEHRYSWNFDICKVLEMLQPLPGCNQCKEKDVLNWFHMDAAPDTIMKICTEEVLREYKNNTLRPIIIDITDDEAGPSRS